MGIKKTRKIKVNHKDIWKIDSAYLHSKEPYEVEVRLEDGGFDIEIIVQKEQRDKENKSIKSGDTLSL